MFNVCSFALYNCWKYRKPKTDVLTFLIVLGFIMWCVNNVLHSRLTDNAKLYFVASESSCVRPEHNWTNFMRDGQNVKCITSFAFKMLSNYFYLFWCIQIEMKVDVVYKQAKCWIFFLFSFILKRFFSFYGPRHNPHLYTYYSKYLFIVFSLTIWGQ